jgi:hypothetical protein
VLEFDAVPTAQGVVSVSIPADTVFDLAGNGNTASTATGTLGAYTFLFDSIRPTAMLTTLTPKYSNVMLAYYVAFSEPVTQFSTDSLQVSGVWKPPKTRCACLEHYSCCFLRLCVRNWN